VQRRLSRAPTATDLFGIELPDEPRWVEAHGLCSEPDSWHAAWPGGGIIGSERAALAVAVGRFDNAGFVAAAALHPRSTFLCAVEEAPQIAGRHSEPAALHTLAAPTDFVELNVAQLAANTPLDHVSSPLLRNELQWARRDRRVWAAWVEGKPVSFAYASWRSRQWFDVSVDTIAGYRQLGLATMVAQALIQDEAGEGRSPVWGALLDDHASMRLAQRLGFEQVDRIWVVGPERAA
jgi:predicted GNAT family acetyltransferase